MAKFNAHNYHTAAAAAPYQQHFLSLKEHYRATPKIISIETYAKCIFALMSI